MITVNMAMSALWILWTVCFLTISIIEDLNLTFGLNAGLPNRDPATGELNE